MGIMVCSLLWMKQDVSISAFLFVVVFLLKIGIRNEAEVRVLVQRSRRVTRTTMCFLPTTAMS